MSAAIDEGLPRLAEVDPEQPLQVLVRELSLERQVAGLELVLRIREDDAVLRGNADKRLLSDRLDRAEGRDFLAALAAIGRAAPGTRLDVHFARFGLRHASAGVLALLGPEQQPLLFARDIPPAGWNVANGGSGSRHELLAIEELLARETHEELLFHDPKRGLLRALEGAELEAETRLALKLWKQRLGAAIGRPLAYRPRVGPDRVRVIDGDREQVTEGIKLCFDVEGFGIESIRLIEIADQAALIPLDGEILDGRLLDRQVGLFHDFGALRRGRPERAFQGGRQLITRRAAALPLCPVTAALLGGVETPPR